MTKVLIFILCDAKSIAPKEPRVRMADLSEAVWIFASSVALHLCLDY
jgi:hypothetical protein